MNEEARQEMRGRGHSEEAIASVEEGLEQLANGERGEAIDLATHDPKMARGSMKDAQQVGTLVIGRDGVSYDPMTGKAAGLRAAAWVSKKTKRENRRHRIRVYV